MLDNRDFQAGGANEIARDYRLTKASTVPRPRRCHKALVARRCLLSIEGKASVTRGLSPEQRWEEELGCGVVLSKGMRVAFEVRVGANADRTVAASGATLRHFSPERILKIAEIGFTVPDARSVPSRDTHRKIEAQFNEGPVVAG